MSRVSSIENNLEVIRNRRKKHEENPNADQEFREGRISYSDFLKNQEKYGSGDTGITGSTTDEVEPKERSQKYWAWQQENNALLDEFNEYEGTGRYQTQKQHDDYYKRLKTQLGKAVTMRKSDAYYNDEIDEAVDQLSKAIQSNTKGREYYKKWDDEESYQQDKKQKEEEYQNYLQKMKEQEETAKRAEEYKQYLDNLKNQDMDGLKAELKDTNDKLNNVWGAYDFDALRRKREDLQATIAERKKEDEAENEDKIRQEYESLRNNEDFSDKSKYVSTAKEIPSLMSKLTGNKEWSGYDIGDEEYEYINGGKLKEKLQVQGGAAGNPRQETKKGYDYVTENEKEIYNYLYATKGKEEAHQYLNSLNLTERMTNNYEEQVSEYAREHPIAASAMSIPIGINGSFAGANSLTDYIADAVRTGEHKLDTNSWENMPVRTSTTIRDTVSEDIQKTVEGTWGKVGSFAYGVGMSMADYLITTGITGGNNALSLAIMGNRAASQAVIDAKERGASDAQAFFTGAAQGIAEAFFEKFSLEQLKMFAQGGTSSILDVMKNIFKGSFTEGSEELFTSVANAITDEIINDGMSEINTNMRNYLKEGYTEEEAEERVRKDFVSQLGMDFAGGAVSGGIMSGTVSGLGYSASKGQTNITSNEVAPAQNQEVKVDVPEEIAPVQETSTNYKQHMVNVALENGKISDSYADTIRDDAEMKAALEKKTGVSIEGTEAEQRNTIKALVETYARTQETGAGATETDGNGINEEVQGADRKTGEWAPQDEQIRKMAELAGDGDSQEVSENFLKNYNGNMEAEDYAKAYDLFYSAGKNGVTLSDAMRSGNVFAETAGVQAMEDAWNMGLKARNAQDQQIQLMRKQQEKAGQGLYVDEVMEDGPMKELQKAVAEKTGIDITRVRSLPHDANGMFIPSMMSMVLSTNGTNEYTSMIHELGEFGLTYNRAGMKSVQDAMIQWWAGKNGVESLSDMNELISEYQKRYEKAEGSKTNSQAMDEMINDAMGGLFSSDQGVEEFVNWVQKDSGMESGKQKTVLQNMADILKSLVDSIKNILSGSRLTKAAKTALQMEEDQATKIRQRFLEVIDRASENAQTKGEYVSEKQVNYELKGTDEDGVEVYETSDDVKNMKFKERQSLLKELMVNQFKGRTAKFVKNGQTYYAQYNEAGINKGVYGDKKSDHRGYRAKVNIGADGNYIELAENSLYSGSAKESGKSNNFHRDANSWDYYVKTIRSDGRDYDVLINVKNTKDNQYVYDITLHEKSTTPIMRQLNPHLSSGADASTNNIASQVKSVNEINKSGTEALLESYDERSEHFGLRVVPSAELKNSSMNPVKVDYTGISSESAQHFDDVIQSLSKEYYTGLTKIEVADKKKTFGAQTFATTTHNNSVGQKNLVLNPHKMNDYAGMVSRVQELSKKGYCVDLKPGTEGDYVATHEFAHSLIDMESPLKNWVNMDEKQFKGIRKEIQNLYNDYKQEVEGLESQRQELKDNKDLWSADADIQEQWEAFKKDDELRKRIKEVKISEYSMRSADEFMAEAFTEQRLGKEPGTYAEKVTEILDKYFGKNQDAQYSLPEENEDLRRKNENLVRENEKYRTVIQDLRARIGANEPLTTQISQKSIDRIVNGIYKDFKSSYDKGTFKSKLSAFLNDVASGNAESRDNFTYMAEQILRPVIEESQNNLELSDYAKDVLKDIRETKISLDSVQKEEVANAFGSYNEFRKSTFGRLSLSNEGVPLDSMWQEWSARYPELFDGNMNSADQANALADIVSNLKEDYVNDYGFSIEDATSFAAAELMEKYENLPEIRKLDKGKDSIDFRIKYRRLINEIKNEYKASYENQIKELKQENIETRRDMSEQMERQKAKMRERQRETREQRRVNETRRKYRNRIEKNTKTMLRWFENNTEKQHIPEVLKKPAAEFLTSLNFLHSNGDYNSNENIQLKLRLNDLFRSLSGMGDGDADFINRMDPDLLPMMNEYLTESGDTSVPELETKQMEKLDFIVNSLKETVTKANKLYQNALYEDAYQAGEDTIRQLQTRKMKNDRSGLVGMADRLLNTEMLDPYSYFRRMGKAGFSVYKEIRNGFNERTWKLQKAQNFMEETLSGQKIKKWTGKNATLHEVQIGQEKVKLTTGQIMNLYVLAQRPQALTHLTAKGGGFTITDLTNSQKRAERVLRVTSADIDIITDLLTPEQKQVAGKMQKFLAQECADWGNEVSMKMYGYKKFGEKTYWPIQTNDNFGKAKNMEQKGNQSSLYAIRNQGMTKSLVKNASNPIVVGDIFDVFTDHVCNMANYNAFTVPLSDAMVWYNHQNRTDTGIAMESVREEMERAFGRGAKSYFINLIKDVNGEVTKGYGSEISDSFTGRYKAAAVGANLRVVIQQPTAYMRAMAVMDPKYLMKAAMMKPAIKESQDNSAIAKWKSWGYFETGIGQSMKNVLTDQATPLEKMTEASMWAAGKADDITWGVLWNAVKAEVQDQNPGIDVKSEEYLKLVQDRFDDVVDQTQVVDTVLHRSQIMRSSNGAVKMATSFMAEPTKSFNLLRTRMTEVAASMYQDKLRGVKNSKATKAARKDLARSVVSLGLTAVATSAASAIIDGVRDDDDDKDYLEKWMDSFVANMADNTNIFGQIPYVKEVFSMVQGYDSERMDMAGISNLITSAQEAYKYANGDSKKTMYGVIKGVVRGLSQVLGVPAYNTLREIESIHNAVAKEPWDTKKLTKKTALARLDKAAQNGDEDLQKKYLQYLSDEYDKKKEQELANGKKAEDAAKAARSALMNSVTSYFKPLYQAGNTQEKIRIKNLIFKIGVDGKQLYKNYDWKSWDKKD